MIAFDTQEYEVFPQDKKDGSGYSLKVPKGVYLRERPFSSRARLGYRVSQRLRNIGRCSTIKCWRRWASRDLGGAILVRVLLYRSDHLVAMLVHHVSTEKRVGSRTSVLSTGTPGTDKTRALWGQMPVCRARTCGWQRRRTRPMGIGPTHVGDVRPVDIDLEHAGAGFLGAAA
ncbi:hypothetical protein BDV95DRAFT_121141 [Massariosphaeria phaeospora]|uniref:Uncharacterized protein n=1 Tax=Massariosphaeria phaeospora TaxID=100035 RepID=A0A7C8I1Y6_9PLEO|nr:hypothetical protein BDV95DRAFT_121141 [Massariosphaeria phaeospora]